MTTTREGILAAASKCRIVNALEAKGIKYQVNQSDAGYTVTAKAVDPDTGNHAGVPIADLAAVETAAAELKRRLSIANRFTMVVPGMANPPQD